MAEDIAKLGIEINSKDILKATKRLDKLEKQSKQNEKQAKKTTGAFKGMGTALGALGLGMAFKTIISLAIEQERVVRQVDAAIKSTGGSAGFTTEELQKMAAGFQDVTTFGDEAILSMQSILLTFTNLKGDVLPATTEAVLDLSARMGIDLQSAAVQLGKALNDPIANLSALSRSGIQFSDSQKDVIKQLVNTNRLADAQKIILKELNVQFGGSAKAARDTFGGALKSLGNAFGDLLEGEGGNLNDAKGAIEELTKVLQDEGTREAFGAIVTLIVGITAAMATMITKLSSGGKHLGEFLANALKEETTSDRLEEINERMERLAGIMKVTATAFEGSPMAQQFIDAREELERLSEEWLALGGNQISPPSVDSDDKGIDGGISAAALEKENQQSILDIKMEFDEADLERLETKYATEAELLTAKYEEENAILEEKLRVDASFQDEYNRLTLASHDRRVSDEIDLEKKMQKSKIKLKLAEAAMAGAIADKAAVLMTSKNKEMFEVGKAAATASALINTYQGATKALSQGGFFGIFMAAAVVAAGIVQVSNIQSQQFGGGGGGGGGGMSMPSASMGAGSFPDSSGLSDVGPVEAAPAQQVSITLNGAGYSRDDVRELIGSINEELGDGAVLVAT